MALPVPLPPRQTGSASVLVVDDEATSRSLAEYILEAVGHRVLTADGAIAAARAIDAQTPDVVIVDFTMPDVDGLELTRAIRADSRLAGVSIIMVTARHLIADKLAGLAAGADDYITKPFEPAELVARVQTALRRARDLRAQSPLTGLPGNLRIAEEVEARIANGRGMAVLYVDLNEFKAYNDHYGFGAGDRVLHDTARVVHEQAFAHGGPNTFVGHVGGDDFIAIVDPDCGMDVATAICAAFDEVAPGFYSPADRERGQIEDLDRHGNLAIFPFLSVAIGMASTSNGPFRDADEAIRLASSAKHAAKGLRRSGVIADRRSRG